ncbi:MAG TPA: hypothetical protein VJP04_12910 [Terriglobales bacterium]|nr:hypothetical protein [Terriglobales bacterium]
MSVLTRLLLAASPALELSCLSPLHQPSWALTARNSVNQPAVGKTTITTVTF